MTPIIYLDHNATAPLRPEALAVLRQQLDEPPGNPGSAHAPGRLARRRVESARVRVAALVGAAPADVTFTGSGTEACNLALFGLAGAAAEERRHAVSTSIEHAAVLEPLARLAERGWSIDLAPVDATGSVEADAVIARLRPNTAFVTVMWANNETGLLQPIETIGAACRQRGVPFAVDATQVAGRLPIDLAALPIDLLMLSAHKLGGPQGAGALVARPRVALEPQLLGGGQEAGLRGGTENVAALVAFGAAAAAAGSALAEEAARLDALRLRLNARVLAEVPGARVVGLAEHQLPNTTMFSVPHDDEELLILALDRRGYCVSAGAACTAGAHRRSHVVAAMGLAAPDRAVVRVSLGPGNTPGDVDGFAAALAQCVAAEVAR